MPVSCFFDDFWIPDFREAGDGATLSVFAFLPPEVEDALFVALDSGASVLARVFFLVATFLLEAVCFFFFAPFAVPFFFEEFAFAI